ncbi:MAG: hypothetical protein WA701_02550 [Solirubrobacterales bacterium]
MRVASAALYIAAYVLAVIDGTMQDKLEVPPRKGFKLYRQQHPWIVAGAICGVLGTVAAALA